MAVALPTKTFQRLLFRWFDQFGRKDLPWQKNKTPYRVWISEIMLQQTQVNTVIAYFERFIKTFPDIETLANANEDAVFHLWSGLGYYHRAKYLHMAAKKIFSEFQGHFPNQLEELEKLPGIGRSTAGAILSIAFDKAAPILDGNVKRVLTRLHGITTWPGEKNTEALLWKIAESYTPNQRSADYTQAIMDFGATLCIRSKPLCDQCPLEKKCVARSLNIEKTLPKAKPRKELPVKNATLLILKKEPNFILLEKRPETGIWAGLWSLPELPGKASAPLIRKFLAQFELPIKKLEKGEPFRHTFTHYHLNIFPVFITTDSKKPLVNTQRIWYNLHNSQSIGLPAPVKSILNKLEKSL